LKFPQPRVTITTHLPLDMLSSLLHYFGCVPLTCTNSCDLYDIYEDADIWDRLLAC